MSSTMTQSNLTLVKLHTTQSTKSIKTNSSRLSNSLKQTSTKLDQKLKKLKVRVSNPKVAHQESEKQHTTPLPETIDESRDEKTSSIDLEADKQDEAKKARRQARRVKWSARRASFKEFAKKIGKAVAISGAVVLGFIFGPVLIVLDLAVGLTVIVIRLLIELVELICAPFLICFAW